MYKAGGGAHWSCRLSGLWIIRSLWWLPGEEEEEGPSLASHVSSSNRDQTSRNPWGSCWGSFQLEPSQEKEQFPKDCFDSFLRIADLALLPPPSPHSSSSNFLMLSQRAPKPLGGAGIDRGGAGLMTGLLFQP